MAEKEVIPVELVQRLAAQGKSEPQIIAELRAHGFTPAQISRAIKEALKEEVSKPEELVPAPPARPSEPGGPHRMPAEVRRREAVLPVPAEIMPRKERMALPEAKQPSEISLPVPAERPAPAVVAPKIGVEELVEQVVEEKWKETREKIDGFQKQVDAAREAVEGMKARLAAAGTEEKGEEKRLGALIESLRADVEKLDSRTEALEKAFKEFSSYMKKK
ncbi:MAG: hypothetical protein QXU82_01500 [Candidatus Aenigmatarchaeota archaeon]